MGIYKNYPNSIYNESNGDSSFFHDSFCLPGSLAYDSDLKRLKAFLVGGGGIAFLKNYGANGLDKFYLKLVFLKNISGGGGLNLLSYRSPDSTFSKGRFCIVQINSSRQLILGVASSPTAFTNHTLKESIADGLHTVEISKDQKNFSFKFDGENLFSDVIEDYTNGFFSPVIGADRFYSNNFPSFYFFFANDYIDAAETRLNINGSNVLGF